MEIAKYHTSDGLYQIRFLETKGGEINAAVYALDENRRIVDCVADILEKYITIEQPSLGKVALSDLGSMEREAVMASISSRAIAMDISLAKPTMTISALA